MSRAGRRWWRRSTRRGRSWRSRPSGRASAVFVVILPDGGRSYLSKLYNDEWMRVNGLLATTGAVIRIAELLTGRHDDGGRPPVVVARTTERVGDAIETLQEYGISQMPVSEDAEGDAVVGIVGSINEKGLLDRAFRDPSIVERTVGEVMDPPLPLVDASAIARRGVRAAVRRRGRPRRGPRRAPGRRRDQARPARVPDPPRRAPRLGGAARGRVDTRPTHTPTIESSRSPGPVCAAQPRTRPTGKRDPPGPQAPPVRGRSDACGRGRPDEPTGWVRSGPIADASAGLPCAYPPGGWPRDWPTGRWSSARSCSD